MLEPDTIAALAAPPEVEWETDPNDGERYAPGADVAGPFAWRLLHDWAQAVHDEICPSCGEFAISAARAVHDVVNVELGKPVQYPDDLRKLWTACGQAMDMVPIAKAARLHHAQVPDKWGSRCRDGSGHWTVRDNCPSIDIEGLIGGGSPNTFALGVNGVTRY